MNERTINELESYVYGTYRYADEESRNSGPGKAERLTSNVHETYDNDVYYARVHARILY